jgi:hypothetical protein
MPVGIQMKGIGNRQKKTVQPRRPFAPRKPAGTIVRKPVLQFQPKNRNKPARRPKA